MSDLPPVNLEALPSLKLRKMEVLGGFSGGVYSGHESHRSFCFPNQEHLSTFAPNQEDPSIVLDNLDNRPNNFEYYDVINQTIYPVYTRAL